MGAHANSDQLKSSSHLNNFEATDGLLNAKQGMKTAEVTPNRKKDCRTFGLRSRLGGGGVGVEEAGPRSRWAGRRGLASSGRGGARAPGQLRRVEGRHGEDLALVVAQLCDVVLHCRVGRSPLLRGHLQIQQQIISLEEQVVNFWTYW